MKQISQTDWVRLAAFIDGEGSINILARLWANGKRRTALDLTITNTDPRLIQWLKQTFGGAVWTTKGSSRSNGVCAACYRWRVTCKTAATILQNCMPFFILKREQAEIGLAHERLCKKCGVKGHPEEIYQQRLKLREQLAGMHGRASVRDKSFHSHLVQ